MYNNITDYVLGPMHGHPYPTTTQRPLPKPLTDTQDGCWLDDSDHPDDDSGCGEQLLVREADCDGDSMADDTDTFQASCVNSESVASLAASLAVPYSTPQSQPSVTSACIQNTADPGLHAQHQLGILGLTVRLDEATHQTGGASPQTHRLGESSGQAASVLRNRHPSTTERCESGSDYEDEAQQISPADDQRSSFTFTLPFSWGKRKRSRSDDSAHVDGSKSPRAEGKVQAPAQASHKVSYKQRSWMLNFKDDALEKQFCYWQAERRTKVSNHTDTVSERVLALHVSVFSMLQRAVCTYHCTVPPTYHCAFKMLRCFQSEYTPV